MNLTTEFQPIRDWAKAKGILDHGDIKTQFTKLGEEFGELAKAILDQDKQATEDAIGDMVVVLTSIAYFNGASIEECINGAYGVRWIIKNLLKNELNDRISTDQKLGESQGNS